MNSKMAEKIKKLCDQHGLSYKSGMTYKEYQDAKKTKDDAEAAEVAKLEAEEKEKPSPGSSKNLVEQSEPFVLNIHPSPVPSDTIYNRAVTLGFGIAVGMIFMMTLFLNSGVVHLASAG